MELKSEKKGDVVVVELLTAVLDASNAKAFREDIFPLIKGSSKVVFNMGAVEFLDSSGCGAILSCLRQLSNDGGDLKVFGLQDPVRTLFQLIRMHRIIEIHNTEAEAVGAF